MKRVVLLGIVLLAGVSVAMAQGRGGRTGQRGGRSAAQGVRAATTVVTPSVAPTVAQRPMRQRVRDINNCQATDGQPLRERLHDPASCLRLNAGGGQRGMGLRLGLGLGCRGGGLRYGCCPCGRCGGGRHHGWRGRR
ncbi:MAG: hypothetical protein PVJ57_12930 [Phycisphaerae bacterium]|jgi:hypothetical protein